MTTPTTNQTDRERGWPRKFSGSRSDGRLLAELGSVICSLEQLRRPDFIQATREIMVRYAERFTHPTRLL